MIRSLLHTACGLVHSGFADAEPTIELPPRDVVLTSEIPFSPLELKEASQAGAAKADDEDIDLSIWALPNETKAQRDARVVLRRFSTHWWIHHQAKVAERHFEANPPSKEDLECMKKCM